MDIVESVERYETWLRARLKGDVNEKDLAEKHEKMVAGPFPFLRATYWRWAETILEACPELEGAPDVLAVGDIHIENFGTWRDTEGRLVWGVNDFDEAADMPYAVDVVRLAASAVLAGTTMSARRICLSILDGYHDGIRKPGPIILDREHEILRKIAVVDETGRKKFWKKFDPTLIREQIKKKKAKGERPKVQPARTMRRRYAKALREAQPDSRIMLRFYERTAGTGSLGRRRFFSVGPWRGDLVVREAKAIVCSGWALAHRGSHNLRCEQIASGRYRSPDPTYQLRGHVLVRRLSPDDFKIEVAAVSSAIDDQLFDPKAANLDLYGGVGLLAAAVGDRFGPTTRITSVESDARATDHAAENLADWVGASTVTARVEHWVRGLATASAGERARLAAATVVLDPPRAGAGRAVIDALAAVGPAQLVYVACDPVAFARDVGLLAGHGYRLEGLRAFDLFPMTHHVEAVGHLVRDTAAR